MRLGIVGASGKLGQYLIEQALAEGHQVHGVCRRESVGKLDRFAERITIFPGRTDDPQVIGEALAGCDAVLTMLVPWGGDGYSTGTATAVLASAEPEARLVFSCGWHISRDGRDRYSLGLRMFVAAFGAVARALRIGDIADQVEACRRIFASERRWTVVRCSRIEEGPGKDLSGRATWETRYSSATGRAGSISRGSCWPRCPTTCSSGKRQRYQVHKVCRFCPVARIRFGLLKLSFVKLGWPCPGVITAWPSATSSGRLASLM